jgi:hypothetical protein
MLLKLKTFLIIGLSLTALLGNVACKKAIPKISGDVKTGPGQQGKFYLFPSYAMGTNGSAQQSRAFINSTVYTSGTLPVVAGGYQIRNFSIISK